MRRATCAGKVTRGGRGTLLTAIDRPEGHRACAFAIVFARIERQYRFDTRTALDREGAAATQDFAVGLSKERILRSEIEAAKIGAGSAVGEIHAIDDAARFEHDHGIHAAGNVGVRWRRGKQRRGTSDGRKEDLRIASLSSFERLAIAAERLWPELDDRRRALTTLQMRNHM